MSFEASIDIAHPRETVFAVYADVASWPVWDEEVEALSLPDGLTPGSSGWLKPRGAPRSTIHITSVEPGRSFTVESKLPLCRMRFGHLFEEIGTGTRVTHDLTFEGPLAFLFRRVIGKSIGATLPTTLRGLARYCEERHGRAAA